MASTKEYANFIIEQLSGLDEITTRKMMGEYILYYHEKVIGGINANQIKSLAPISDEATVPKYSSMGISRSLE